MTAWWSLSLAKLLLLLQPFNGLFSRTTWVSRYQKGITSLDLNEARDDGDGSGINWTICKRSAPCSRQNHINTSSHTHTHTHPFNGPLSRTTRVSRYKKGKTNLDFTEARDSEWQLGHMSDLAPDR